MAADGGNGQGPGNRYGQHHHRPRIGLALGAGVAREIGRAHV